MPGVIYLHRRDLRLTDNRSLTTAVEIARERAAWLLVLILWEPKDDAPVPDLGVPRLGPHYRRVWRESVDELSAAYRSRGQSPIVAVAAPETVVRRISERLAPADDLTLCTPRVPGTEEDSTVDRLSGIDGVSVLTPDTTTLLTPEALSPYLEGPVPATFSAFRRRVEGADRAALDVPPPAAAVETIPPPPGWAAKLAASLPQAPSVTTVASDIGSVPQLTDPRVLIDRGGERSAAARLHDFVWESGALRRYKETRNGLLGTHYSSRMSAALAHGTVSPRQLYREIRRHEAERGANESTYWLGFELLWRDFYHLHAFAFQSGLFRPEGYGRHARPLAPRGLATGGPDATVLQRWIDGKTGDALVDAAMRELAATGFTSNRARQNAASFLIYDLRQPWWTGAAYFEHILTDYDPASNWGNWAYIAGVGADSRGGRHFNTRGQAETYDPDGTFRRFWQAASTESPGTTAPEKRHG